MLGSKAATVDSLRPGPFMTCPDLYQNTPFTGRSALSTKHTNVLLLRIVAPDQGGGRMQKSWTRLRCAGDL
jgi:hypothetical protein